jgi:hypothetical protein
VTTAFAAAALVYVEAAERGLRHRMIRAAAGFLDQAAFPATWSVVVCGLITG